MSEPPSCPRCGDELPAGAPAGLCPRCLLAEGLALLPPPSELSTPPAGEVAGTGTYAEMIGSGATWDSAASIGGQGPVRTNASSAGALTLIRSSRPGAAEPGAGPGRYEFLGEIARGGMGAVLRGRDLDLGRDLAIKVLLESHRDRPDHVRRFVEEAQIGCQLQHPGIVPVYDLGALPDRRPFFTMKLVRGRTLAEMLRERPDPGYDRPRFLAIFEQICQTVAYAHARAVIHRDLKPSNVMVGAFGEVQVMDWGLAKVLHGPDRSAGEPGPDPAEELRVRTIRSGSDADASRAGAVMGTASYMAPEQARGEIHRLDERADVFALGAILCEILTGRPPYVGHSHLEVVRLATAAETSDAMERLGSSGADPALLDLARRCLATEPDDRPRDAGEVAGAVTAYLAGVQERLRAAELARVEAQARADEERKRRRVELRMSAALLAVLVAGIAGVASQWRRAESHLAEAERANAEALARRDLAIDAIETFTTGVSRDVLLKEPRLESLRKMLLGSALAYYRKLQARLAADPRREPEELAAALERVAELTGETGSESDALQAARGALAIRERLTRESPQDPKPAAKTTRLQALVGRHLARLGTVDEAVRTFEEALDLGERMIRAHPDDPEVAGAVAFAGETLGEVLSVHSRSERSVAHWRRSGEIYEQLSRRFPERIEYQLALSRVLYQRAVFSWKTGRPGEARGLFEQALAIGDGLLQAHPDDIMIRTRVGEEHMNAGIFQVQLARHAEARRHLERARSLFERLSREQPNSSVYRECVARSHSGLGYVDVESGRPAEALDHFREASKQFEELTLDNPAVTNYQAGLAQSRLQSGDALKDLGRLAEALPEFRAALATYERLSREHPEDVQVAGKMVNIHMALGDTYLELKRGEEGEREFLAATTCFGRVKKPSPADLRNIAAAYTRLAEIARNRPVGAGPADEATATVYADHAVGFLRESFMAGRRDISAFRHEPALRDRPDFRLLLLDAAFPDDPFGP